MNQREQCMLGGGENFNLKMVEVHRHLLAELAELNKLGNRWPISTRAWHSKSLDISPSVPILGIKGHDVWYPAYGTL